MKDIKRGYYASYDGKEYRIGKTYGETLNLISHNICDMLEKGFEDITDKDDIKPFYRKRVLRSDIGEIFSIYTVAIYHGLSVGIESYTEDKVLLATSDKIFYEKYGFEEVERNVYMKEVPFEDVELVDKRSVVTNFFH